MCGIAEAGLAIAALSAAASVSAQEKSAGAQTESNKRNAEAATQANNANQAAITTEQQQQSEMTAEQIAANNKSGAKALAANRVSAGEAGVAGRSVDSMLREIAGLNATDNANATAQYLRGDAGVQAKRINNTNSTNSIINNLKTPAGPDYLSAGLKIAGAGMNAYQSGSFQASKQYNYSNDESGERFSATGDSVRSRR